MGACWHRTALNECKIIGLGEICPGEDPMVCVAWMDTEIPCPVCAMASEGELHYLRESKYFESFFCEECDRKFSRRQLIEEYSIALKFLSNIWSEMLDDMDRVKNIADKAMKKMEIK